MKEKGNFLRFYGKVVWCFVSCLTVAVSFAYVLFPHQALAISFLDVGQGDSILIRTPSGHTMLVDGGPNDKVLSGLGTMLPLFSRDIDIMVATHPDADHVTGLIPALEKYDVHALVVSGETSDTSVFAEMARHMDDEHAEMHVADAGDVIDFEDGVTATILHPYIGEHFKDTNSASVSMVVSYGEETFLLTGDLPSDKEPLLMSSGLLPKNITVYKAGHHGSKYSSGEQLLTYIKPEYAVISAGKDNKYGHPNPEALERLGKYAKEILSTIDKGMITFLTDGTTVDVRTER
jgi:competence protein ComEC